MEGAKFCQYAVDITDGKLAKLKTYLSSTFADGCGLVVVSARVKVQVTAFLNTVTVGYSNVDQLTLSTTHHNYNDSWETTTNHNYNDSNIQQHTTTTMTPT